LKTVIFLFCYHRIKKDDKLPDARIIRPLFTDKIRQCIMAYHLV